MMDLSDWTLRDKKAEKRTVFTTEEMGEANYNSFSDCCLLCNRFSNLPDKYWCIEHDTEITQYGICDFYEWGDCIKEMIAETDEHRKWRGDPQA